MASGSEKLKTGFTIPTGNARINITNKKKSVSRSDNDLGQKGIAA
jgi:hypothetical protein